MNTPALICILLLPSLLLAQEPATDFNPVIDPKLYLVAYDKQVPLGGKLFIEFDYLDVNFTTHSLYLDLVKEAILEPVITVEGDATAYEYDKKNGTLFSFSLIEKRRIGIFPTARAIPT